MRGEEVGGREELADGGMSNFLMCGGAGGADALVVCAMGIFLSRAIAKRNATQADHA